MMYSSVLAQKKSRYLDHDIPDFRLLFHPAKESYDGNMLDYRSKN
jgi:hypothetical protein